jgi:DNA-damage-inducible protein D
MRVDIQRNGHREWPSISLTTFGIFQDFGYKGLYSGETAKDIAARKGLEKGEHILDWMGPEELADNIFRTCLGMTRCPYK